MKIWTLTEYEVILHVQTETGRTLTYNAVNSVYKNTIEKRLMKRK